MNTFGCFNFFEKGPFEVTGECSDEVILNFDDGKKLYVSQNFLCYASPVLKAMLQDKSRKGETNDIVMTENSGDFLELLLSLHPGVQKEIDKSNVLRILSYAKDYRIEPLIEKCQDTMLEWLTSEVRSATFQDENKKKLALHAKNCLTIMLKATALGYEKVVSHSIEVLAEFGHDVFTGTVKIPENKRPFITPRKSKANKMLTASRIGVAKESNPIEHKIFVEECKTLFDSLPEQVKTRLLLQRLKICDDGNMR